MKTSGIYKISNSVTKQFYVGSSHNISKRWYKHRYMLTKGIHPNQHLQNAVNKYGLKSFTLSILELTENLLERENHFIRSLQPAYNIASDALGGDTISKNPNKPAIVAKIRASNIERWAKMSPTERARLRLLRIKANTGLKRSLSQYKCRIVTIDGVQYPSLSEAARKLQTPITTLQYRLRLSSTYVSQKRPSSKGTTSDKFP